MVRLEIGEYLSERLNQEIERIKHLDDKAVGLLEAIGVILSIQATFFFVSYNKHSSFLPALISILTILASSLYFIAALSAVLALRVRDYIMPDVEEAYRQSQTLQTFIIDKSLVAYLHNKKQNDEKAKRLNVSFVVFFLGLSIWTTLVVANVIAYFSQ